MYLEIDGKEVGVQFIGKFNVSNLLAVYGAAIMLGKKPEDILIAMSTLKSVNGRLEPIQSPEGFTAVVDYAHTPDALENVLCAIHDVLDGKGGHVITVCGAGGHRDKGKRPLMAQEVVLSFIWIFVAKYAKYRSLFLESTPNSGLYLLGLVLTISLATNLNCTKQT